MFTRLQNLDLAVARTRLAWRWIGEFSLVALGVHLAADHFEDLLFEWLVWLGVGHIDPISWATQGALLLEVIVASRVLMLLVLSAGAPRPTWHSLRETCSVETLTRSLFWLPTGFAGAWVLGMTVEDAMAAHLGDYAFYVGALAAGVFTWRLLIPSFGRLLGGLSPPRRRTDGWYWAPPLLLTAAVAFRFGLPVWGVAT